MIKLKRKTKAERIVESNSDSINAAMYLRNRVRMFCLNNTSNNGVFVFNDSKGDTITLLVDDKSKEITSLTLSVLDEFGRTNITTITGASTFFTANKFRFNRSVDAGRCFTNYPEAIITNKTPGGTGVLFNLKYVLDYLSAEIKDK